MFLPLQSQPGLLGLVAEERVSRQMSFQKYLTERKNLKNGWKRAKMTKSNESKMTTTDNNNNGHSSGSNNASSSHDHYRHHHRRRRRHRQRQWIICLLFAFCLIIVSYQSILSSKILYKNIISILGMRFLHIQLMLLLQ